MTQDIAQDIAERVRERYAAAAQQAVSGERPCCSRSCCPADEDVVTGNLYDATDTAGLPEEAVLASLGCGNPTALIGLQEGQTVLDLGSGGGIDVLLSAKRVGPSGFVYGLDMTDEMLALAMANKEKAGATNVAFLKGHIDNIPLPAGSVDVVISNCVINLAADKSLVLQEAFRVLKPGGHLAVSDVVAEAAVPVDFRRNMEAWVGCLAGALEVDEYKRLLADAGFEDIGIDITRRYTVAEAGLDTSDLAPGWETADGKLASAFVRAAKPAHPEALVAAGSVLQTASAQAGPCCDSGCCNSLALRPLRWGAVTSVAAPQSCRDRAPQAFAWSGDRSARTLSRCPVAVTHPPA